MTVPSTNPAPNPDPASEGQWDRQQRRYWDGISREYDALYQNYWSRRENTWVERRLSFLAELQAPTVLDLGCGTGLGLQMVRNINDFAQYIGLDISPGMLGELMDKGATKVEIGSMEDLSFLGTGSVDAVISLFSSVSYARRTEAVLNEVSRVLAPGGYAYLSLLSSSALSRLRTGSASGRYRTRGDRRADNSVPVRAYTCTTVIGMGLHAGLQPVRVTGMNLFSGLAEVPRLWTAGRLGARLLPNRAHTIEAIFQKVSAPGDRHA